MKNDLSLFQSFAPKDTTRKADGVNAVIYTRVSHVSQEDNTSLESQKKYCEDFAAKRGLNIVNYFGGTYESAKTDERKEFNRMLSFVKKSKGVSYIIVYSYERFSRTGMGGAQIADELLKKYGIITLAVTQELDPTTSAGSFQQKILFLFGQMDNEMRKDKTVTGMKELIMDGYYPHSLPRGYENLNKGAKATQQKIVLNDLGKMLQKAFHWKADLQMRNSEIAKRLQSMGVKLDERRVGEVFKNPFYCGLIVSKMLPGQVYEGKHEPMVSRELFLRVNNIVAEARNHPVTHKDEDEHLPLKRFMKCASCDTPMTGYLVRKKGLYYYKCRTKGCKHNKSAKQAHEQFKALISAFRVDETEQELVKVGIETYLKTFFEELTENERLFKVKKSELQKKLNCIEENFATGEIPRAMFEKFNKKYTAEIQQIEDEMQKMGSGSSNLKKCVNFVLKMCRKPQEYWEKANIGERTIYQNILFPAGIVYDGQNNAVRTNRINAVFAPIPEILRTLRGDKKREATENGNFSYLVTSPEL